MAKFNYYREELGKIETKSNYAPTMKIKSISGETKWMDLNEESAQELADWLKENYNVIAK